jgi:hypothetical protein
VVACNCGLAELAWPSAVVAPEAGRCGDEIERDGAIFHFCLQSSRLQDTLPLILNDFFIDIHIKTLNT